MIKHSEQWPDENDNKKNKELSNRKRDSTDHTLIEATIPLIQQHQRHHQETAGQLSIPQNQQESVLQKFRKSFSLRFNKRGSKEGGSTDGDSQLQTSHSVTVPSDNDTDQKFNDDDQHKNDNSDQKFRLVSFYKNVFHYKK